MVRAVLERCHILAGLAIVENAYDETARIVGVAPEDFEQEEPRLLQQARQWLPKLPFDRADVLLIAISQYLVCSLLNLSIGMVIERDVFPAVAEFWWVIAYTGIVSVGLGYTLQAFASATLRRPMRR